MAKRRAPGRGLLEQADDTGLFGMCTDAQSLSANITPTTTEARTNLTQQVFPQSKGLGGYAQDPIDGSGLIHVIWGVEYNLKLAPLITVDPSSIFQFDSEAWLSRDRDSGIGIARLDQADEQDFAKVMHGTVLGYIQVMLSSVTGTALVNQSDMTKRYWFNQPYVAIQPYYLDGKVDSRTNSAIGTVVEARLTAYVYYQLKRVDRKTYEYLMEKYSSGTGGMKSRARELS